MQRLVLSCSLPRAHNARVPSHAASASILLRHYLPDMLAYAPRTARCAMSPLPPADAACLFFVTLRAILPP